MKRLLSVATAIALILLLPLLSMAADGTVAQTTENYPNTGIRKIIFTCIGSADDGSIPVTTTGSPQTSFIEGYQLFQVDAYPTAGGTAPDPAHVFILDENGLDLLGSIDGSTTAYGGLNLISATLATSTTPQQYIPGTGVHLAYFPYVTGALQLKVTGQATVSADYTIVLSFWREKR